MPNPKYTVQVHQEHRRHLEMLKVEFEKKYNEPPKYEKNINDYDRIKAIGTGAYGEVFLVRDKCTFTYHAMKAVDKSIVVERKHVKHMILEKKIQESLNFPFLVPLNAAFKDNLYLYFVLPFIAGGELFNYIQKYGNLSDTLAKFYASQVVLAIEYMHYCDVVHRDIKPENILIDTNGFLKLCDFGFCKVVKKNKTWTLCGTPEYLAPEIIISKGYSFPVDWWAIGVLIFEMIAGHPPFMASDPNKLYEKVLDGNYKVPEGMNTDCKQLLKGLLQVDPTKRFGGLKEGIYDIKNHPWFHSVNWHSVFLQRCEVPFLPTCSVEGDTTNFPEIQARLRHGSHCLFEEEFEDF